MTASNHDRGRNAGALILIGIGVLFLFGQVFGFNIGSLFNFAWPFFIIIPGVLLLFAAMTGGRSLSGLAIPGMIVTGTGLILFFQETFNYYESWAYAWTLYPGFVGAGMFVMGLQRGDHKQVATAQNMLRGSLMAFILFGGFFELLIFHRLSGVSHVVIPLLFIAGGVLLLTGRRPNLPFPPAPPAPPMWTGRPDSSEWGVADKRKNDEPVTFDGDKPKNGDTRPSWDLNRRIEEAIRDDSPDDPKGFV